MMFYRKWPLVWLPVLLAALTFAGCGASGPETAPVSGTVTLDGSPVDGAAVVFVPAGGGRPASATTDPSGNFTLEANVGRNAVTVSKTKPIGDVPVEEGAEPELMPDDSEEVEVEYLVPMKYGLPSTSGLSVDVQKGMDPVTLTLTSE